MRRSGKWLLQDVGSVSLSQRFRIGRCRLGLSEECQNVSILLTDVLDAMHRTWRNEQSRRSHNLYWLLVPDPNFELAA